MGYKIGGAHTNRMSGGSAGCFVGETMIVVLPVGADVTEWEYRMIKDVQLTDLIWDGSDWCAHDGVVCHGMKRVYNWDGLVATKNHMCFTNSERKYTEPFKWFMDNRYVLAKAQLPAGGKQVTPVTNLYYADGAKVMVYDILNVGPRHCYVANGKLVHNSANMQNLPSGRREGQSDLLRRSIIAQGNSVIVNYDASQIECRVLAYIANQTDVLGVFASGGDVYSFAASRIYGTPYEEITKGRKSSDPEESHKYGMMRQYGKTATLACIAGDTEVLSNRGWVRMVDLRDDDRLWDGEAFVAHEGLIDKGEQECIDFNGVTMTPDHKVFDGKKWEEAQNADESQCANYAERRLPAVV